MQRLHPDSPVTFRDLIEGHCDYPVLDMSQEEFDAAPKTTHVNWSAPDGWEKTGYLSPNAIMVGYDHIVYWTFNDFQRYGYDQRPDVNHFLVHVDGQPVIQRVSPYAKTIEEYVLKEK